MSLTAVGSGDLRNCLRGMQSRTDCLRSRLTMVGRIRAFAAGVMIASGATIGLAASAAESTSAQTSLAVPAATYTIDPRHTQVIFAIQHMGLSTFYGRFGHATGTLAFDPAQPTKSALNVVIDMTNIDTHVPELDKELGASIFHADKFPTATFVSTEIVKMG